MIEHHIDISTADGAMNTFVVRPEEGGPFPVVLFYMDAPGKRESCTIWRGALRRWATSSCCPICTTDARATTCSKERTEEQMAVMFEHMRSLGYKTTECDTRAMLQYVDAQPQARRRSYRRGGLLHEWPDRRVGGSGLSRAPALHRVDLWRQHGERQAHLAASHDGQGHAVRATLRAPRSTSGRRRPTSRVLQAALKEAGHRTAWSGIPGPSTASHFRSGLSITSRRPSVTGSGCSRYSSAACARPAASAAPSRRLTVAAAGRDRVPRLDAAPELHVHHLQLAAVAAPSDHEWLELSRFRDDVAVGHVTGRAIFEIGLGDAQLGVQPIGLGEERDHFAGQEVLIAASPFTRTGTSSNDMNSASRLLAAARRTKLATVGAWSGAALGVVLRSVSTLPRRGALAASSSQGCIGAGLHARCRDRIGDDGDQSSPSNSHAFASLKRAHAGFTVGGALCGRQRSGTPNRDAGSLFRCCGARTAIAACRAPASHQPARGDHSESPMMKLGEVACRCRHRHRHAPRPHQLRRRRLFALPAQGVHQGRWLHRRALDRPGDRHRRHRQRLQPVPRQRAAARWRRCKRGVLLAGGLPVEFPTISIHESFAHPTSMFLRNLMSIDTEEMIRAQPMDAVVLIGGCDKTVPAQLMGAASAGVPAMQLVTGSMLTGSHRGETRGRLHRLPPLLGHATAPRRSTPTRSRAVNNQLVASVGTCSVMGTASTMACIAEALGMCVPGGASPPAVTADRIRIAEHSGARRRADGAAID